MESLIWDNESKTFHIAMRDTQLIVVGEVLQETGTWSSEIRTDVGSHVYYSPGSLGFQLSVKAGTDVMVVHLEEFAPMVAR
ncbi:MAG: hypothetical protein ACYC5G_00160 [Candidatus Doudnabacteria bacterium]